MRGPASVGAMSLRLPLRELRSSVGQGVRGWARGASYLFRRPVWLLSQVSFSSSGLMAAVVREREK